MIMMVMVMMLMVMMMIIIIITVRRMHIVKLAVVIFLWDSGGKRAICDRETARIEAASREERRRKPEESKNNNCNSFIHKSWTRPTSRSFTTPPTFDTLPQTVQTDARISNFISTKIECVNFRFLFVERNASSEWANFQMAASENLEFSMIWFVLEKYSSWSFSSWYSSFFISPQASIQSLFATITNIVLLNRVKLAEL